MSVAEIAARVGLASSSVRVYLAYPDGSPRVSSGTCTCGAQTSRPGHLCLACAGRRRRKWNKPLALEAISAFVAINGRHPTFRELDRLRTLPSCRVLISLFGAVHIAIDAATASPDSAWPWSITSQPVARADGED
jgi:hypothetical protein